VLHSEVPLSRSDVQALSMLGKSAGGSEATLAGEGDAVHGKAFSRSPAQVAMRWRRTARGRGWQECTAGRPESVDGFAYSAGLKNSGITWTDATLERWLTDPDMVVKDNNMSIGVPKAEERRDLIPYLKQ
jgi:cytochrome c